MKCIPILALAASLAISPAVVAQEDRSALLLSVDENGKGATMAVTGCPGLSQHECVTHHLTCSNKHSLSFYMAGGEGNKEVLKIITSLLSKSYGESKIYVKMAKGKKTIEILINEISAQGNDMDGDWGLSLVGINVEPFYDALSKSNAEGLTIQVISRSFDFDFGFGDVAKIMKFKQACAKALTK